MSYKRAWMLVEEMNAAFQEPLILSTRGRPGWRGRPGHGGGPFACSSFIHDIVDTAQRSAAPKISALEAMLRPVGVTDVSDGK